MKKIDSEQFRVKPGKKVKLDKWRTLVKPVYDSKEEAAVMLAAHQQKLSAQQNLLYASDSYSLLLIFQAMDAAGKDSTIAHVMSGVNPQGCQVYSFKHPSAEEIDHDFLWRTTRCLPERGRIGIFNRSYYEEVLVVRVHPEILHGQNLPPALVNEKSIWKERFKSMRQLEDHLSRNGTKILKFFLHISKDEQRKRFLERIDRPEKNWKFGVEDIKERGFWDTYMRAYEECLSSTSSKAAPWYIVPADDKQTMQLIVSKTILDAIKSLKISYPTVTPERQQELQSVRSQLVQEKSGIEIRNERV
ncbi:MAG: ADP-polyphosphate phosphotransferase [Acidobacteriota bacterium]